MLLTSALLTLLLVSSGLAKFDIEVNKRIKYLMAKVHKHGKSLITLDGIVNEQIDMMSDLRKDVIFQNTMFQERFYNQNNTITQLRNKLEEKNKNYQNQIKNHSNKMTRLEDRLEFQHTKFQKMLDNQKDTITRITDQLIQQNQTGDKLKDAMTQLKDQNTKLQTRLDDQNRHMKTYSGKVTTRLNGLEALTSNQSIMIQDMDEKDNFMTGFSAGYSGNGFKTNDTVLFNKMRLQVGDDYNTTTGRFKAPKAGYYVFNLIVLGVGCASDVRMNIVVNDQPVSETYTFDVDTQYKTQTSVNAFVKLEVGDVVRPVVKSVSGTKFLYRNYPFASEFNGYILKAV